MIFLDVSIGHTGIYGLLGYAVVFFGLILLMILVSVIGKIFVAAGNKKAPVAAPVEAAPEPPKAVAPGTAGQLKLYNVDPKTAAMLMAIVADKLQKPVNELRFLSIREVEQ